MKGYASLMRSIAEKTGFTVDELKDMSPEELRDKLETRSHKKIRIVSEFPVIGRGNVLRDGIVESKQINSEIDKILGL